MAAAFQQELKQRGLEVKVTLKESGCQGLCAKAVKVMLRPQEITYQQVKPEDVPEIVEETLVKGKILDRLCYQTDDGAVKAKKSEIPFYQGQQSLVLGKMDLVDPTSLDDYLAAGGYQAVQQVFGKMSPEAVIDTVERSGLRGRGGGGFLTGRKWRLCRQVPGDGEISHLQRRRRRPRGLHGPGGDGGRPPRRPGRHDHRRLRHRRQSGLHLCPP